MLSLVLKSIVLHRHIKAGYLGPKGPSGISGCMGLSEIKGSI